MKDEKGEKNGITPGVKSVCQALSGISFDEWLAVKSAVDGSFEGEFRRWDEELGRRKVLLPLPDSPDELFDRISRAYRRRSLSPSGRRN